MKATTFLIGVGSSSTECCSNFLAVNDAEETGAAVGLVLRPIVACGNCAVAIPVAGAFNGTVADAAGVGAFGAVGAAAGAAGAAGVGVAGALGAVAVPKATVFNPPPSLMPPPRPAGRSGTDGAGAAAGAAGAGAAGAAAAGGGTGAFGAVGICGVGMLGGGGVPPGMLGGGGLLILEIYLCCVLSLAYFASGIKHGEQNYAIFCNFFDFFQYS